MRNTSLFHKNSIFTMTDEAALREALFKLYLEHCTHVRHHETQRAMVAASILVIATALLGLVTFDKAIGITDVPLTILLVFLGLFGVMFSAKQYERASLHALRARHYRNAVDATLVGQPLKMLKRAADTEQKQKFGYLVKLRLNNFWAVLYILLAVIGCALTVIAVFFPQPVTS